jgi:hypothetical protein
VDAQNRPIVYMLWGTPAQTKAAMLHNSRHLILKAPHPSPLSAYRGFLDAGISANATPFWRGTGLHRSTGRLRILARTEFEDMRLSRPVQQYTGSSVFFSGAFSVFGKKFIDEIRIRVYNISIYLFLILLFLIITDDSGRKAIMQQLSEEYP